MSLYNSFHGKANSETSISPEFKIEIEKYSIIRISGTLFSILTFGLYQPWYISRLRRYVWSSTSFDGDAFEYHGNGRELILGLILGMVMFLPILVNLAALAPTVDIAPQFTFYFSLIYYPLLFLFIQFAIYSSRGYRLSRTSFRSIRFRQTGSGWIYAILSAYWSILTIMTLGFAFPWMRAAQIRYRVSNTWYGNLNAQFSGRGSDFAAIFFPLLLCCAVLNYMLLGSNSLQLIKQAAENQTWFTMLGHILTFMIFTYVIFIILFLPLLIVQEYRCFLKHISLDGVRATSQFSFFTIIRQFGLLALVLVGFIFTFFLMGILVHLLIVDINISDFFALLTNRNISEINVTILVYAFFVAGIRTIYNVIARIYILSDLINGLRIENYQFLTVTQVKMEDDSALSAGISQAAGVEFGY